MYVWCCSWCTFRSWWITHLTQHHQRGCNSATAEDVVLRVHVTWQQKMRLVRKPGIVNKVWHSVNLVAKPREHDHSIPHVVRCISFCLICILQGYMWRSAIKILRSDSRLIPSSWLRRRTDLLGLWTTVYDSSSVVWCPWWFRSSRVWLSVSVFTIEVMHSPMGSELVDPAVDHWVDR